MSEFKLKAIPEVDGCSGCFLSSSTCFNDESVCENVCNSTGINCFQSKVVFVIDDSAVETDKPQSTWTHTKDADLIDGEEYRIAVNGEYLGVGVYYAPLSQFTGTGKHGVHFVRSVAQTTHVIHLQKPQPPEVD